MSKQSLPSLERLLTDAVRKPEVFRGVFVAPAETARQLGIPFGPEEMHMLTIVYPHLKRFGTCDQRAEEDANSWAVGILADQVVPKLGGSGSWGPSVTSIQRRHTADWP
jgi:hypothetical protein